MKVYLKAPADRPLDEGQLLQLLQRPEQHAGLAQSHPGREHQLTGTLPVSNWKPPSLLKVVSGGARGRSHHRAFLVKRRWERRRKGRTVTSRFQGDP